MQRASDAGATLGAEPKFVFNIGPPEAMLHPDAMRQTKRTGYIYRDMYINIYIYIYMCIYIDIYMGHFRVCAFQGLLG